MEFLRQVARHREQEKLLAWEDTFAAYLPMVIADPRLARTAHARIYDMIVAAGVEESDQGRRYRLFADELFGLEPTVNRLVEEYFHAAARGLDVRRRILLLVGPVGAGKSTIVNLLKRGLEAYSRTPEGALYAIRDCPMHEDPLHLVPRALRPQFFAAYGIRIEGDLCPFCRLMVRERYDGRIEDVPVRRIFICEEERIGIGTFSPSDPKSQDIAELTGSLDFATIGRYGAESDPRAYRFDGELNKANRGLMEFQEILKADERFLYLLLSLAQEGNFKTGRFALISADEVVIGHTNEAEYRQFLANPRNEALRSRFFVVPVPYNLRLNEEVRIYQKMIRGSDLKLHLDPRALWAAAVFSVLSRLKEPSRAGVDLVQKMYLYNGEAAEGFAAGETEAPQAESGPEGMSGVDPRFVLNRLSAALVAREGACLDAPAVLHSLEEGVEQHPGLTPEERERLRYLLGLTRREYDRAAVGEVEQALRHTYAAAAHRLFETYLDNVRAYYSGTPRLDLRTGETAAPDEGLMRAIEEQIGVGEAAKHTFRQEIALYLSGVASRNRSLDYRGHARLREAVEKKVLADPKEAGYLCGGTVSAGEEAQRRAALVQHLVKERGYCPACAQALLRHAGPLLGRAWGEEPCSPSPVAP